MKLCRHMKMLLGVSAIAAVFSAGLLLDRALVADAALDMTSTGETRPVGAAVRLCTALPVAIIEASSHGEPR